MSGLSSGQFVDYLIIGAITSVCGAVLDHVLKSMDSKKSLRITTMLLLVSAAVCVGYMRTRYLERAELQVQEDHPKPSASPEATQASSPTATPTVSPTPVAFPSPEPRLPSHQESPEETFIRVHVAPLPGKKRSSGQWAVIVSDPQGNESYPNLANAAYSVIREAGQSTVAVFRPSATRGPAFDTLFSADPALSRRLHDYCDQILLGKVSSDLQKNPIYPELSKLTLTIEIEIISTSSGRVEHQIRTSAVGAGSDAGEARANAEENLTTTLKSELRTAITM
jgi:hypothetical protein